MDGFYTTTTAGHLIHINGDPNMSEETRLALCELMDAAAVSVPCLHKENELLQTSNYGSYIRFNIRRCDDCKTVFVEVLGDSSGNGDQFKYLQTLPTRIAPYCTGAPQHGYAYYWRFDSLNHSTKPIAPKPEE